MVAKKAVPMGKDRYQERLEIIAEHVREILSTIDEPPRQGIEETPMRVARMYMDEIYHRGNALEEALSKVFPEESSTRQLVVVREMPILSWCEHHILPWFGVAHVGYIPNGLILGLSKLARVAQAAGTGLTIQERVTDQIADAVDTKLKPYGVMVVIKATHTCMVCRGVKAGQDCNTLTSAVRGVFRDSESARMEFLSLIGRQ